MQKTITPRAMAEGALLAVITAVLALAGAFIPLASLITFLVVAVPIIIVVVRNDLFTGIMASIVAAFLVGILAGPLIALIFYIQFMFLALVYGFMLKNNIGSGKILVIGTLVAAVTTIVLIFLTMAVGQVGLEQQKEALFNTVDSTIEIYEDYGMMEQFEENGINKEELRIMLTDTINLFIRVLPALLIMTSIFTAITHFIMARLALKKLGYDIPKFPKFSQWRLPWYAIWGLISGWGSFLLGDVYNINSLTIIGQNIMIAYGIILFVLGLSVLAFYILKYQVKILGRLLIALFVIMFIQGAIFIIILLGMFDLVADFRKIGKHTQAT